MSLGQFFELLQISIYYITQMEFFLIKKKKKAYEQINSLLLSILSQRVNSSFYTNTLLELS